MLEQQELLDTETEFFFRDKDNVDDFLFELNSSYSKKESADLFNNVDMIFIEGDSNVRPWSPSLRKVIIY